MENLKAKIYDLLMEKQKSYEKANREVSEIQFNVEQRGVEIQKEIDELIKNKIEDGK